VVASDTKGICHRVLTRWRDLRLPTLDEFRASAAIARRLLAGVTEVELLEATEGARARSLDEGWTGVVCAFAVVMASDESAREYARRGREALAARRRREQADRERHLRELDAVRQAARRRCALGGTLARSMAAASAGQYGVAARLAHELEATPITEDEHANRPEAEASVPARAGLRRAGGPARLDCPFALGDSPGGFGATRPRQG
jgi:hypothetical protein